MKLYSKFSLLVWFVVWIFMPQAALAELAAIPDLTGRVTDLTQTLSANEQAALEAKLAAFEQKKGSQIAVLIVPSTQPEDIAQYSIRVVEKWKIGREKVDDGVLLLVAKEDRKLRVEVGYGLEGAIPDIYAKRIINEVITPRFKQGDFFGGLDSGTDSLIGLIEGELLPASETVNMNGSQVEGLLPLLLFGGLISGIILRNIFGTFLGAAANGSLIGSILWLLGLSLFGAAALGVMAFFMTLLLGGRGINGYGGRGYPTSGGWSSGSGSSSWGGGGGGGFGGGGASGSW